MSLKAKYKSKSDIPEGQEAFYVEKDGEFILQVEGMVPKDRIDEFRDNNIDLKKQLSDLQSKMSGFDMDKILEALKKQQGDEEQELIKAGKIDELIEMKLKAAQEKHASEYKTVEDANKALTGQLETLTIDNALRDIATKAGVADTAMSDVLSRGKQVYKLVDGKPTPHDSNGNVIYKTGSTDPMGMDDWMKGLSGDAPHLFKSSSGGGSQHGNGGSGGEKTMSRGDFDNMGAVEKMAFVKDGGQLVD